MALALAVLRRAGLVGLLLAAAHRAPGPLREPLVGLLEHLVLVAELRQDVAIILRSAIVQLESFRGNMARRLGWLDSRGVRHQLLLRRLLVQEA